MISIPLFVEKMLSLFVVFYCLGVSFIRVYMRLLLTRSTSTTWSINDRYH